jgi:hypothetical protein
MLGPLTGIAIVAILAVWTFGGLNSLGLLPRELAKYFSDPEKWATLIVRGLAALLVIIGLASYFVAKPGFCYDFSQEMVAAGFGVLGIDQLNRWRSTRELKLQTFRQIRFSSNAFALEALLVARHMGWFDMIICPGTDLQLANLAGAVLGDVNLAGATLWITDLTKAKLGGANLEGAELGFANLTGTFLEAANLANASLENATLTEADFESAYLMGASFKGAIDSLRANFMMALYDSTTIWPNDFDPRQAGAINLDELSGSRRKKWEDEWVRHFHRQKR